MGCLTAALSSAPGSANTLVHHGHIWPMNPDGRALKQLSFGSEGEGSPTWSPDSKWIAAAQPQTGSLMLIAVATGKIRGVTSRDDNHLQARGRLSWR